MATDIVDGALGVATFPATYNGPGTKIGLARKMGDVSNYQWYNITSGGNAIQINCGFTPRKIKVVNTTDGLVWEWQYGMPAANSIKLTLGTVAAVQDTGSAFAISTDPAGNSTVTLSATVAGSAKNLCVELAG